MVQILNRSRRNAAVAGRAVVTGFAMALKKKPAELAALQATADDALSKLAAGQRVDVPRSDP